MRSSTKRDLIAPIAAQLREVGCVFAEEEAQLLVSSTTSAAQLAAAVARRRAGEPLEHVLGWVDFAGVRVSIRPGVFVPRQRSRVLVRAALERLHDRTSPIVVELCCGAGAVAASIQARAPHAQVWASDHDPAAVAVAAENLAPDRVLLGDLTDGLPRQLRHRVDVIVANAPYVPTDEIATLPVEAREHEPRAALDGGPDGVDIHRRLAAAAPAWLASDGVLVVETSRRQLALTEAAMGAHGLRTTVVHDTQIDGTAVVGYVTRSV